MKLGKKIDIYYYFRSVLHLLSSGALTSLGLMLISSGYFSQLKPIQVIFIISLIQWQQLGLTFAKLGMDQISFVIAFVTPGNKLDYFYLIKKYSIIVSWIFVAVIGLFFHVKAWGVLGLCILFDVFATAKVSELNARKAFVKTNIANFLKTPFFLIIVVVVAYYFDINDWIILSFFLLACFSRFGYLYNIDNKDGFVKIRDNSQLKLGIQQILNYVLFRINQYLILVPFFIEKIDSSIFVNKFLFMARYPEIVSGVLVGVSPLYLPYINKKVFSFKYVVAFVVVLCLSFSLGGYLYKLFWAMDATISFCDIFPFALHCSLILYVNALSFVFLKDKKYNSLICNLSLSLFFSALLFFLLYVLKFNVQYLIYYIVPVQLLLFIVLSLREIEK